MATSDLMFDLALIRHQRKASRLFYKPLDAPLPAVIPKTLLIDDDSAFIETFASLARRMKVPFQSFRSADGLEARRTWDYDLVLLDDKTVGKENILDLAVTMTNIGGDMSIILIGDDEPTRKEMLEWSPYVKKFLYKDWDAETLFNDAIQVYASETRGPYGRYRTFFGGPNGAA